MWNDMHPAQCYGCRYRETEGDESVGWAESATCEKFNSDDPLGEIMGEEDGGTTMEMSTVIQKMFGDMMSKFETIAFGLASINNCPFFEKPKQKTIYDATRHLFEEK